MVSSGHHWTTTNDDGWDVQSSGSHQHAGHDLVAVGDHNDPIDAVSYGHHLDAISDQFAAGQGHLHPWVSHCNSVAHADNIELQRCPSGYADACFDSLDYLVEMYVSRDKLVVGIRYGDNRAVELFLC